MRSTRLLLVAIAAALALEGGAGAANVPGRTFVDKTDGFAITVPSSWQLVPTSVADVKTLVTELDKKKETNLASVYADIISTAAGRAGVARYKFHAFDYPLLSPVRTEVTVGYVAFASPVTQKQMPGIAGYWANSFAATKGSKVTIPKTVTLPAGTAQLIEAIIPAGSGLYSGVELYLIPHGKRVYDLTFGVDSQGLSGATLFTSMANEFKFV